MQQAEPLPVILFGGPSAERMVSVASAQNVLSSAPCGLEPLFIAPDLQVYPVSVESVLAHRDPFTSEFVPAGSGMDLDHALAGLKGRTAFIALHGTWGEDGSLQEKLDFYGIRFSASGARACQLAFDKTRAKAVLAQAGVAVPAAIVLDSGEPWQSQLPRLLAIHGPYVLKPVCNGSSIGLHIVKHATDLEGLLPSGNPRDYIAEEMIVGREFTVGVVDGPNGLHALPVSEIKMSGDSNFDYSGKYLGKGSTEITPALIDPRLAQELGRIATIAHELCGCAGYSRTDILVDARGPVFLEINTHPGLSKASFIPQQLAAAGQKFADFLQGQLAVAARIRGDQIPLPR